MLKELRNLLAFLTILPLGMNSSCLTDSARYMYLFPAIGALIGLGAGIAGWILLHALPNLVVGVLSTGLILLLTGLHHTDGLLDFGDGLMHIGPPMKKIEIMHDQQTGTGGLILGLFTILTTAVCIGQLNAKMIIPSMIISEVSAKLAMVFLARSGKSAHEGMNTHFINIMHDRRGNARLAAAIAISFAVTLPLLHVAALTAIVMGLVTSLLLLWISNQHFGGVTGDVIGAANDLVRASSLLSVLVLMKWV